MDENECEHSNESVSEVSTWADLTVCKIATNRPTKRSWMDKEQHKKTNIADFTEKQRHFRYAADFYPHRQSQHLPNGRNVNTEDILSCTLFLLLTLSPSRSLSPSLFRCFTFVRSVWCWVPWWLQNVRDRKNGLYFYWALPKMYFWIFDAFCSSANNV